MTVDPISLEEFTQILETRFADVIAGGQDLAVGVSGGPDSLALVKLLSEWAAQKGGPDIHALIVDHGLRSESSQEAKAIASYVQNLNYVKSNILKWKGEKLEAGVQEQARQARYSLMGEACKERGIEYLFLGHHQDDQAETVLFRLAKGSGLDGLTGMRPLQELGDVTLVRPLLDIPKERLIKACEAYGLEYVQDPSNESEAFARVRLRKSMAVLEEEGLSAKRLSVTAARLARARKALDEIAAQAYKEIAQKETKRIEINFDALSTQPEEIGLRVVMKAIEDLCPEEDYLPRMEKLETLFADLMVEDQFRKRTLGGLIFERDDQDLKLIIQSEDV